MADDSLDNKLLRRSFVKTGSVDFKVVNQIDDFGVGLTGWGSETGPFWWQLVLVDCICLGGFLLKDLLNHLEIPKTLALFAGQALFKEGKPLKGASD